MRIKVPAGPLALLRQLAVMAVLVLILLHPATAQTNHKKEREVIAANEAFYVAFRNRDLDAMDAIWAKKTKVSVIHPGWNTLVGRDEVMSSWHRIISSGGAPKIESIHPIVLLQDESAVVLCYEKANDSYLAATNVFVLEDGDWRMIHHHAGPAPSASTLFRGKPI